MTSTQHRAQGVEFLGAGQWAVYTDHGHVQDTDGKAITFTDEDTAWAFVDGMNAPA